MYPKPKTRPRRKAIAPKTSASTPTRSWRKRLLLWIGVIVPVWIGLMVSIVLLWYIRDLPDLTRLQTSLRTPTIELRDRHGQYLMRWGMLHKTVELDALPAHVPQALLAVEDRRFFDHYGVDGMGLARALYQNLRRHKTVQGGSTLTQQLAKNLFLTPQRSLKRKLQEWVIALWLEAHLSKKQILTLYLNRAYFGGGAYGIEAAARTFFSKSSQDLTLYEAALLIGLLKAPSHYTPLTAPEKAQIRARVVLGAMQDAGFISRDFEIVMPSVTTMMARSSQSTNHLRYFMDWIVAQIHQKFGELRDDLVVITTLDFATQAYAEQSIQTVFAHHHAPNDLQASCLCLDQDGAVRAMVGGRDYWASPLNRITQTQRSAGSVFKFFVYACALECGWKPQRMISDQPFRLGKWRPQNYQWSSRGMIPLSDAFAYSVNTATARLAQQIGIKRIHALTRRLGVTTPLPHDLTLALGSGSMSALQLGGAYHAILSEGRHTTPYGILRIFSKNTAEMNVTESHAAIPVFTPQTVAEMKHLLSGVVTYGTAKRVKIPSPLSSPLWLGAKTGTSQDHRDAWIVGLSTHKAQKLTTVFWVGYDDGRPTEGLTGGRWPAEMWQHFLTQMVFPKKCQN